MSTAASPEPKAGLHVMSKPIGPICNLDCEYCYYLHKEELYPPGEKWKMSPHTLETYIAQYIAAQPTHLSEITFAWQGGEPTMLGIDFFQRVVDIQNRIKEPRHRIVNALQTNGVLLNEAWCELFRAHDFLVGLSIDGPAEFHDKYRYDKQGQPTFRRVLTALKLLKHHQVEFNALVVVNRHNGDHGGRVYSYLRDSGVEFLQFIPIVERRGVGAHADHAPPKTQADACPSTDELVSSRSVRPEQFGDFLIAVFDNWLKRDVGRVFVQIFDQALSAWMGQEPSLCVFRKECGRALALEHNGDLLSCDHFVDPEHKLGNIHDTPLVQLAESAQQQTFGRNKQSHLPQYCRDCEVRFACNGECPKNRFLQTPDGDDGLNYLCAGYRKFFNHIDPYMKMMVEELQQRRPAANVMHRLQASGHKQERSAPSSVSEPPQPPGPRHSSDPGRNGPCPCGSGRKFKKCCMPR
ncbi:MAG: anaerobic sulfatase maturase [Planctomycetaceae bacterium]